MYVICMSTARSVHACVLVCGCRQHACSCSRKLMRHWHRWSWRQYRIGMWTNSEQAESHNFVLLVHMQIAPRHVSAFATCPGTALPLSPLDACACAREPLLSGATTAACPTRLCTRVTGRVADSSFKCAYGGSHRTCFFSGAQRNA